MEFLLSLLLAVYLVCYSVVVDTGFKTLNHDRFMWRRHELGHKPTWVDYVVVIVVSTTWPAFVGSMIVADVYDSIRWRSR